MKSPQKTIIALLLLTTLLTPGCTQQREGLAPLADNTAYFQGNPMPPCDSYGDIDSDGYVTTTDAAIVSSAVGTSNLSEEQQKRADVTGDGEISSVDATGIYSYATGKTSTFEVCEEPPPPPLTATPITAPTPQPTPIPQEATAKTCYTIDGLEGITGTKAVEKVLFKWGFESIQYNTCEYSYFCDPTQFSISLAHRLEKISS